MLSPFLYSVPHSGIILLFIYKIQICVIITLTCVHKFVLICTPVTNAKHTNIYETWCRLPCHWRPENYMLSFAISYANMIAVPTSEVRAMPVPFNI
jgi:hypothetical protein